MRWIVLSTFRTTGTCWAYLSSYPALLLLPMVPPEVDTRGMDPRIGLEKYLDLQFTTRQIRLLTSQIILQENRTDNRNSRGWVAPRNKVSEEHYPESELS